MCVNLPITILAATPDDAGELMTVQRAAYLSQGRIHNSFELPALTETLEQVRAAVACGGVFKALLGARIVGTVRARIDGDTCHIGRLAVAPDMQGTGLGSRLLAEVEARFGAEAKRFELFTGPMSARNVELYHRLGYREIPPPEGAPDLIFMEKFTA